MIKLERKKLKIEIDGGEYELRFPTAIERQRYADASSEEKNALTETIAFLVTLGLPKDVVESMEIDHMFLILEEFRPDKKKT